MSIRLLLVDDHPVVLEGMRAALASDDILVIGAVGSVADAERTLATQRVDVALVDVRLPDGSGLDLVARACRAQNHPAFLVMSSFDSPRYPDAALNVGAAGFLVKTATTEAVIRAVRRAADGDLVYDADVLARRTRPPLQLSPRDRDIVAAVVRGMTNDEIATRLGVSVKTVERHLGRIFERASIFSRTELAARAEREGWLDLPPA